uniref:Uncharacterized protein n=1 Tax=Anguilla anguilla TaxID=7936 RepID=A0A0E9Q5P5_ANGAN
MPLCRVLSINGKPALRTRSLTRWPVIICSDWREASMRLILITEPCCFPFCPFSFPFTSAGTH